MRHQFIEVLQRYCKARSEMSPTIKWWFSDQRANTPGAHRAGTEPFTDEGTIPFGRDPDVETLEDPPLGEAFFQQINYG